MRRLAWLASSIIIGIISILVVVFTTIPSNDDRLALRYGVYGLILLPPLALASIGLLGLMLYVRGSSAYAITFAITGTVFLLFITLITDIPPFDDQLTVMNASIMTRNPRSGILVITRTYMERFPYQSGLALYMASYTHVLGATYTAYRVMQYMNIIPLLASVAIIGIITRELSGRLGERSVLTMIIMFPAIPMYCYKVYGNVLALPFMLSSILACIRLCRHGDTRHQFPVLLASVLMMTWMKPNALIIVIAIIMVIMGSWGSGSIPMILGVLAMSVMGMMAPQAIYGAITGYDMRDNRQPSISWVAEGLTSVNNVEGAYNERFLSGTFDVSSSAARSIAINGIRDEVNGFTPSSFTGFITRKMGNTWADPSYDSGVYAYRTMMAWSQCSNSSLPIIKSGLGLGDSAAYPRLSSTSDYYYHHVYVPMDDYWNDAVQGLVMILVLIGVMAIRRGDWPCVLPALCLAGGFMFHLLWETQPEYGFPYVLICMPYVGIAVDWILSSHER